MKTVRKRFVFALLLMFLVGISGISWIPTFAQDEDNHPPSVDEISSQTLDVGGSVSLAVGYNDEDGDVVSITAASDNSDVASVSQSSEFEITVVGVSHGTANITVTVDDGQGGSNSTSFAVTVNNRAPSIDAVSAQTLDVGQSAVIALNASDPDGDVLTLTVSSDNSGVASLSQNASELTVTAVARGTANVTVTVDDGQGGSNSTSFAVTVNNQAPSIDAVDGQTLEVGQSTVVTVSASDPDGDAVIIAAVSDNSSVASVSQNASDLTISAVGQGTATVTVAVDDGQGGTASTTFSVVVNAPPPPPTEPATEVPTEVATEAPTEVVTAIPTEDVAPEPTVEPTAEPTTEVVVIVIPTEEPTQQPTEEAAAEPTEEPTSVFVPSGPPSIASDKFDYMPGEVVTLTGQNWQPGETVHLFVNDDFGSTWNRNVDVVAAADGTITDQFQLPWWFVAVYRVVATASSGTAVVTFTDAPLPNSVSMVTWRTQPNGGWINGTLQGNNSDYAEGETVPFRMELGTLATAGNPYTANICRDYQLANGVFGFTTLTPFNTSRAATAGGTITSTSGPFSGVNITITSVNETGLSSFGGVVCGSTQRLTIVTFNATASGPQYLLWGGRMASPADPGVPEGKSASFWSGGSLQMRLASPDKTSGIQPGAVVRLAKITVQKIVDSGSALPAQWCFNISPNPAGDSLPKCPAAGTDTVTFFGLPTGSYSITETNVAGYTFASGTGTNCTFSGSTATANVTASQTPASVVNATCIFHNALALGTLIVKKVVINDNGGTLLAQNFSFQVNGGSAIAFEADGQNDLTVNAGTYNVTEPAVSGYTTSYDNCSNIVVPTNGSATCTITNNDNAPSLTLQKVVTNDNGGTALASAFTLTATGPTGFSGAGPSVSNGASFDAGTYDLSETNVAGYTASAWECVGGTQNDSDTVTVGLGQSVTCTITNNDNAPSLTLQKVVTNDNGGTALASAFTLTATGPTGFSGAGPSVSNGASFDAGTYDLSETNVAGYTASAWECVGGTQNDSDTVTVGLGQSVTCTITNDDQPGTLIVKKVVMNNNGGTLEVDDFSFQVNGDPAIPFEADGQNDLTVNAGTYNVTEPAVSGYATSYDNCSNVVVPNGGSATCTITNNDIAPSLTLMKVLQNNNGGNAVVTDFVLSADGPTPISGAGGATSGAAFQSGTYNLSETTVAGYAASPWVCVGGTQNDDDTVTLALGQSATCTITNDDIAPTLTLIKNVVKDNGGTAQPNDFALTVGGNAVLSGVATPLSANTAYAINETVVPGYTFVGITGNAKCPAVLGGTVTLDEGENVTCTITNDDDAPTLTLVKQVINDNGGTATESQFTLTATGPTSFSGAGPSVSNGASFDAGTYTLSETTLTGYTASAWDCDGGTQNGAEITLALGDDVVCTITNNDDAPTLTLVKDVINDNGGLADESDFTLTATGPTSFSGAGPSVSNGASFDAGTYTLSETTLPGYTASAWSCEGGTQNGAEITLALGDDVICTITNNDDAPTLTLVKDVINDNGGLADESDFTLTATGPTGFSGAGPSVSNGASFDAGTYILSETNVTGYTASAWSCEGGTQNGAEITLALGDDVVCTITNDDDAPTLTLVKEVINDNGGTAVASNFTLIATGPTGFSGVGPSASNGPSFDAGTYTLSETNVTGYTASVWDCEGGTQNGAEITLALGDDVVCTITNDDDVPSLTLVKVVVNDNGGEAVETDFVLSADGPTPISGAGGASSNASFDAGTYDLSETGVTGYTASAWDCEGGTQNGSEITLVLGEDVICTITNDDDAPTLTLEKVVITDNGGTADESDFTLIATGPTGFSGVGPSASNGPSFDAGTYTLSETTLAGYTASAWECVGGTQNGSEITLELGDDVTCTITNDDQPGTLIVKKIVVTNNGGTLEAQDFSFQVNGDAAIPFESDGQNELTVDAGTYDVVEPAVSGYTTTYENCSNIVIPNGGSATCTITNDDQSATLIVKKIVVNNNGGTLEEEDFTFEVNGGSAVQFEADGQNDLTVDAGTYDVVEPAVVGYATSYQNCSDIVIPNGGSATCTITNNDIAPSLTLVKVVVTDNGGNAVETDFVLSADGPTPISGAGGVSSDTDFEAGTYTLSETTLTGYTASAWDCEGGTQNGAEITLALAQNVTCTITNDDIAPTLKLVKVVVNDNGGNAQPDDFDPTIDGGVVLSGVANTVDANTPYEIDETLLDGYTFVSITGAGCPTELGGTVTLNEGEDIICTITNDDVAPTLTLVKVVVNDNGGNAAPDDFDLTIGNLEVLSGVATTVFANTPYAIDETLVDGYEFVSITGDAECPAILGGTVTLDEGEDIICTITNDDVAPTLTLVKVVLDDNGGNAEPDDFDLTIGGMGVLSGVATVVDANTPYAIDETLVDGYSFVSITGTGCPTELGGTVTLDEGEDIICTITNDDIAPTLTLVKVVLDDNGGNAEPDDFDLTIGGAVVLSGVATVVDANTPYAIDETLVDGYSFVSITGAGCPTELGGTVTLDEGEDIICTITNDDIAPTLTLVKVVLDDNGGNALPDDFDLTIGGAVVLSGVATVVDANTPYAIDETLVDGYSFVSISGAGCPTELGGTVTLDEGEDVTCTITNDDIAPTLTLVKVVLDDNGGNALPDDFDLTIGGAVVLSGVATVVDANTPYAIDETLVDGYSFVSISGAGCPTELGGTVTLDEGEDVTCTITNDDVAPTLTLVKVVVNDNGGNALPDDFDLTIGGAVVLSGVATVVDANTAYAIDETLVDGYSFVSITGAGCPTELGGTVTLDEGEDIVCTITNDDIAPTLTLVKVVLDDNGGNALPDDFDLTIGGMGVLSGVATVVDANTPYAIDETLVDGYSFVSITGAGCPTELGGTVTLDEGEDIICTITNDDIAPTLTLVKVVLDDNGGNALPDDFDLTIGGAVVLSGVATEVDANTPYAIDETLVDGYSFVSITGAGCPTELGGTVTLDEGEDITCTITNDDIAPSLTLVKVVLNDNGGNAVPGNFTLTATGPTGFSGVGPSVSNGASFDAGTYALSETTLTGYTPSAWSCQGGTQDGANITLELGESATCTITNDDVAPKLTIVKNVINDNGGTAQPNDFALTVGGNPVTSGTANTLSANTAYAINETLVSGYSFVSITGNAKCPAVLGGTITLDEGDDITCTITNNDIQPKLKVIKVVVNNDGGTAVAGNFTMNVTGSSASPSSFAGVGAPGKLVTLNAGSYNVTESGPSGYQGTFSADCSGTIAIGQVKTCTVTNDDIPAHLIVIKKVINNNGRTAVASDFTMQITGVTVPSGGSFPGSAAGTDKIVYPGSYTVTELNPFPSAYTVTYSAECKGTIALGQTKTCTVTNDDTVIVAPRTPGYWKNHQKEATPLLPIYLGNHKITTFAQAKAVFDKMNCGSSKPADAIGCLAGHLLAAKFNVASASNLCILSTIQKADSFLKGGTVNGVVGINYTGPSATYNLTTAQRNVAISLKDALDRYNNGLGCP